MPLRSTEPVPADSRLQWLDFMKVLAAFMVCFYHLTEGNQVIDYGHFENGVYNPSIDKVLYGILSACVPLFFIASGVTLRLKDRSIRQSLWGAARLLFVAYSWGFILKILLRLIETGVVSASFSDLTEQPFYFWYLPTLAFIYCFDAIWIKLKSWRFAPVFFYLLLLFPFLSNLIFVIVAFYMPECQLPSWSHTGFFRMYSLVYVFLPVYFTRHVPKFLLPILFAVGVSLVLLEVVAYSTAHAEIYDGVNASFPTIGALLIAYSIYSMCRLLPNQPWLNLFSWLGRNCLGIYILHYPMIAIYNHYTIIQHTGWLSQFCAVASIILITGIVSSGLRKLHLFI